MHARARDIMTTRVVAVGTDASYREMATLLRVHRVSGLPVVDAEGIVVGVVSETDLLTKHATAGCTAADLMTRPAVTTSPGELVSSVAQLMSRRSCAECR
jgi:CBS domain-containing protein